MLKIPDSRSARLLQLAQYIEESDDFDMNDWDRCICGHARKMLEVKGFWTSLDGANALGLTQIEANALFMPCIVKEEFETITKHEAAKALRHLAVTGEVRFG